MGKLGVLGWVWVRVSLGWKIKGSNRVFDTGFRFFPGVTTIRKIIEGSNRVLYTGFRVFSGVTAILKIKRRDMIVENWNQMKVTKFILGFRHGSLLWHQFTSQLATLLDLVILVVAHLKMFLPVNVLSVFNYFIALSLCSIA